MPCGQADVGRPESMAETAAKGLAADQHQHEEDQDHDAACVNDDLRRSQELCAQRHKEDGQRDEVHQQEERAVNGLAAEHDARRAGEADDGD